MRTRLNSILALVAGFAVIAAPQAGAYADRGRGGDDRQRDDRGGRGGDDGRASNGGSGSAQGQNNRAQELRFVARMRDGATTARARYEEKARGGRALRQKFDVEIKFAEPGERFEVRVDGRLVGTVTANNLGFGKLELRRSPDDAGERPIPSDFPRLRAGAVVTVGPMQGTLAAR